MIHANPRQRRLAVLALLASGPFAALGQGADGIPSAIDCISLTRVTGTEVLDEQTILFHMRGQQDYSNYLPRECPGLDAQARFTYRTTNNRLCSNDTITLLEHGSQLSPGATCRLGKFVPASAERIVDLTQGERERGRNNNAIEVRRIELPRSADTLPAEGAPPATDEPAGDDTPAAAETED
jgi:hypothetical protein